MPKPLVCLFEQLPEARVKKRPKALHSPGTFATALGSPQRKSVYMIRPPVQAVFWQPRCPKTYEALAGFVWSKERL